MIWSWILRHLKIVGVLAAVFAVIFAGWLLIQYGQKTAAVKITEKGLATQQAQIDALGKETTKQEKKKVVIKERIHKLKKEVQDGDKPCDCPAIVKYLDGLNSVLSDPAP